MTQTQSFSAAERTDLLARYYRALRSFRILEAQYEEADEWREAAIEPQLDETSAELQTLAARYRESVPVLALSRCPFTGGVWRHSFDPYGIDGLWWDADRPVRPEAEPLGGRYLCFTGAMQLVPPVEVAPITCRPGPEIPFVVPRLLNDTRVKAVISQVKVGPHTGYLVVYYASAIPLDVERTNDWGAGYATYRNTAGEMETSETYDDEVDYDFDIERWIDRGKLAWLDPADPQMNLRYDSSACPFTGLEGRRIPCRVRDGEIWWPEPGDLDDEDEEDSWAE